MDNKEIKNLVRKEIKTKRENMNEEEKKKLSNVIIEKFLNLPEVKNAKVVMSYMAFKNEVESRELNEKLLELGKKVLIPKVSDDKEKITAVLVTGEYKKGHFGIMESTGEDFSEKGIDIIIVPGVAFNKNGGRIGFGKGYYDKFISERENLNEKSLRVSLAYDFQIDNRFSAEKHDKNIHLIITEKRIIETEY